jgi:hypothetical protein
VRKVLDIYCRLYKFRETASVSPAENFLTEALADIINRLPMPIRTELLVRMLPASCSSRLQNKCKDAKQIDAVTQVPIVAAGSFSPALRAAVAARPGFLVRRASSPTMHVAAASVLTGMPRMTLRLRIRYRTWKLRALKWVLRRLRAVDYRSI